MYRPLPDSITIKNSEIEGLGLFATKFIPKFTNLGQTHIYNPDYQDSYIRTPLGGFFNHSENPNCKIVESGQIVEIDGVNRGTIFSLITINDINPGDEITAFYTLYQPK